MKKTISLVLALVMCLSLCACGGEKENSNPQVVVEKNATIKYEGYRVEDSNIYLDFNYTNTGKSSASIHDALMIQAFQDGVELPINYGKDSNNGSSSYTAILPDYSTTYIYSFALNNTESPVVIQYCSWGFSKVISEFTVEIATE